MKVLNINSFKRGKVQDLKSDHPFFKLTRKKLISLSTRKKKIILDKYKNKAYQKQKRNKKNSRYLLKKQINLKKNQRKTLKRSQFKCLDLKENLEHFRLTQMITKINTLKANFLQKIKAQSKFNHLYQLKRLVSTQRRMKE